MAHTITAMDVRDIRMPTSKTLAGSDAMNPDPDYSAAYVTLSTDSSDGLQGHGMTFTIGRGTEVVVAAANALRPMIVGHTLESFTDDMGAFWRYITGDSQLRWIGPEKGAMHLATAAVVNAVWDLWAKSENKPVWKLVADMSAIEFVRCVDFRYITDAITPDEALALLDRLVPTRGQREAEMLRDGYPAYLTSAGWIGYPEQKTRALFQRALADGWDHFKIKVGTSIEDDIRRCEVAREEIGPVRTLMVDANQVWDVGRAISHMEQLRRFNLRWIEEPTSPDDVLGHAAIRKALAMGPQSIGVATGEHCANRVMFKQFLQAGAMDYCQVDSCRLGGLNEVLAVLLMAAKFGVPVCPHAGGVGLCEYVQHISLIDYLCVSGSLEGRMTEFADHLHEHFVDPVVVERGRYLVPMAPGYSITMHAASLDAYEFPGGEAWRAEPIS
jgi:L-fuconate dehydratase